LWVVPLIVAYLMSSVAASSIAIDTQLPSASFVLPIR
jgi:hypothetical protein